MGHIKRPLILVLFIQLFSHSEPKTIAFNAYSNEPSENRQHNVTQPNVYGGPQREAGESSGRGFSSAGAGGGGGFPYRIHPDFLTKPVQVARPDAGYKSPKYIVYPSYSENSPNSVPYYNGPVAMDRFAPGEAYGGTIYKLKKQKQPFQSGSGGAPFASIPAASFNSPVSVPSPNVLRPAASDNSPVSILAPPSGPSNGPPPSPPAPGMPSQTIFMPTPIPNSGEDSSSSHSTDPPNTNSTMDSSEIILFPPNSHTGYLPPAQVGPVQDRKRPHANTQSSESAETPSTGGSSHATIYKPTSDLLKFPPNSNSSYLPPPETRPKLPVTSYIPPPSGDGDTVSDVRSEPSSSEGSAELFKFPPNVNSGYLPPAEAHLAKHTVTSYLPPPSGDPTSPSNLKPVINNEWTNPTSSVQAKELYRFPPNVLSNYSPASEKEPSKLSDTSYLPPPSGDPLAPANLKPFPPRPQPGSVASVASDELSKFPPNIHTAYLASGKPSENPVTSYLPPPSGTVEVVPSNGHSNYLPPKEAQVTSYLPPPSGNPNSPANLSPPRSPPSMPSYVPPVDLYRFPPNVHSPYLPPINSPPRQNNAVTSYLPPASGIPGDDAIGTIPVGPGKPQYLPPRYPDNGPPLQAAPMPMAPMKMPPMSMMQPMGGPPDVAMDGPPTGPSGMDGDHDHHHHHDHDFPYLTGFDHDHYPDIIYDHDHFHHHHDEPPTTPAPPPPPPAPETPRLKNYSYYYLSRTLWYVPLYFTLYFTVYVAILIIRSIARHKVNLPNQWVGNGRSFASIRDLSDKEAQQKATMMATFAMKQIEDFREKYL